LLILYFYLHFGYYDPKIFSFEKDQYGYQKNAEFYADFKFVDAGFQKCP